jgi:hypothetical protein
MNWNAPKKISAKVLRVVVCFVLLCGAVLHMLLVLLFVQFCG